MPDVPHVRASAARSSRSSVVGSRARLTFVHTMSAVSERDCFVGDRRAVVDDSIAVHLPFHVHDRSPGNSVTNPSLPRVDEDSIDAFFALSSADA
eukprot:1269300-Prymnesium_polylepis.1